MGMVKYGCIECKGEFLPTITISVGDEGSIDFIGNISFETQEKAKIFIDQTYLILSGHQQNIQHWPEGLIQ